MAEAPSAGDEEVSEGVPPVEIADPPRAPGRPLIRPFTAVDEGVPGRLIPIEDPTGRAMHALHDALDEASLGRGKARLMFFGASHVASDWFTHVIRKNLQARFGDAGHGFVMPVHPWRTYRHFGVELRSNGDSHWDTHRIRTGHMVLGHYGFAGVAVESREAGAYGLLQTASRGPVGRTASSFELFYFKQPGGGDAAITLDGELVGTVVTEQAETGAGYAAFRGPDAAHRFELRVNDDRPVRLFGVAVERDAPGVIIDTLGINGARARYHLLWEDTLYRDQLQRRNPNFVALAYGTNEAGDGDVPVADYEGRLRQVLTRIRETVPNASCLLIGPSDRPVRDERTGEIRDRPRTTQLVASQRAISAEFGCGFFDVVAFMGGPMSMVDWVDARYGAPDHVHYTRRGYERLGTVLTTALLHGYQPPNH